MRILLWHGWLLEGSGSNVYTARIAEVWRAAGHDVLLLCQERHPKRYPWIDAWGSVTAAGPSALTDNGAVGSNGRCVLLRPSIGDLMPVFVVDRYEGFASVKRFVDLTDRELDSYLHANIEALRAAAAWHDSEFVLAGHAIPGAAIARRALGDGRFSVKIHGSDIEYAIRPQGRYRELAKEGLSGARAMIGASRDVLVRARALVPGLDAPAIEVRPGVDAEDFRPLPRRAALLATADRLDTDTDLARGRPPRADAEVRRALRDRDADALDALAGSYDQEVPDAGSPSALRKLAEVDGPIVGSFGKLIPQKGVELVLGARSLSRHDPSALIVGFGSHREWLVALAFALRDRDADAIGWIRETGRIALDDLEWEGRSPGEHDVAFTGRLDHRYAPGPVAAMDVLVVPSILEEAFGMVAAEGASAGALPLVARHSGLQEVAEALESQVGRPGLFSFEPGPGAIERLTAGIDLLLSLPEPERNELRASISAFVAREWSWERTAELLLDAGRG